MPPAQTKKRKSNAPDAPAPSSATTTVDADAPAASNADDAALSVQQQCFLQALLSRGIVDVERAEALYRFARIARAVPATTRDAKAFERLTMRRDRRAARAETSSKTTRRTTSRDSGAKSPSR